MWKIFDKSDEEAVTEMDLFVWSHTNSHFMQTSAWAQVKTFWDWRGIIVWKEAQIAATMLVLIRPLPLGFSLLYSVCFFKIILNIPAESLFFEAVKIAGSQIFCIFFILTGNKNIRKFSGFKPLYID